MHFTGFTIVSNVGMCSYNILLSGLTVVSNVGRCSYNVPFTAVLTTDLKFLRKIRAAGGEGDGQT